MKPAPTIAALHDLSGVGRCALTVVIPVISAMGVQVIPAPTAVLSNHTAFEDFVGLDLTDYLESCLDKWCEMHWTFDCVYSGYLASVRQAELALRFMERQPGALRVVDPVMGDDGVMYRALPGDMPAAMRRLIAGADVITPNLTEACLLTGTPYPAPVGRGLPGTNPGPAACSMAQVETLLEGLMALGPRTALLTGAPADGAHLNAWMTADGRLHTCAYDPVHASFPGTGDLFSSVLSGALVRGQSLEEAVALATDYVRETMLITAACGTEPVYGVQLERTLSRLTLSSPNDRRHFS